jgi:predicted nucleic acid-binding protein
MRADFIDSNVFVYLFDGTDERKRTIARDIVRDAIALGSGVISHQVVQETLNVLTRSIGATPHEARRFLDTVLTPLWSIAPSPALYADALDIRERYRFSFYDSLIVAAATSAGCTRLLSEDLQPGQTIGTLTITNPFLAPRATT